MENSNLVLKGIGIVFSLVLMFGSENLKAQTAPTGSQTASPSPGGGITGGGAPIETTLFAYRALASDAEAVAAEVAFVATKNKKKIVIGTAADIASFAQWRAIMGESMLLERKAKAIRADLASLVYIPQLSLLPASLHIIVTHSGSFSRGRAGAFIVVVSNDPLAGPTAGPVTVTESLPAGLTLTAMLGLGWRCDPPPGVNCSRNDVLLPGASYPAITISVSVANSAPPGALTNSVVVAGGGSVALSASDTVTVTAPGTIGGGAARAGGGGPPGITPAETPAATPPVSPLSVATSAIPALVQLAQFVATAFAVNQTLTASQGSMTDAPLMNMIARHLEHENIEVFLPSAYMPNLLKGGDLTNTYLWSSLTDLDDQRILLWSDIATASQLLNHANFVTLNPTKFRPPDVSAALLFAGQAQSYINAAQSLAASIDSFEASLFGGQSAAPASSPGPSGAANPSGTGNPSGNAGPAGSPSPSGTTPASTNALTGTQATPAATTTQSPAGQGGNLLPQILCSDLLARRLWGSSPLTAENFDQVTESVEFLAVHALESGGSQLNKTNIFYGTHIFFSGGAVMTFSLYKAEGDVICSGFAYNYRGNVREKHYERALHSGAAHDAILSTDFPCPADFTRPNQAGQ
jgi:hypothetical protein